MANLTYNTSIFTNVHKWDDEFSYLGILLSGKLNQVNGQGYPIIDAIDIDWNGAYVKNYRTYIYTTEDLINLLNLTKSDMSYITDNYVRWDELTEMNYKTTISYDLSYRNTNDIRDIVDSIENQYDILNQLTYSLVYKSRYIQIDYNDLITESELISQGIYIYNNDGENFTKVDKNYVYEHGYSVNYYRYLVGDTTYFEKEINRLKKGFNNVVKDIDDINSDIDVINETISILPEAYNLGYSSYQKAEYIEKYAIDGYNNSYLNTQLIGYHTTYNVYKPLDKSLYTDDDLNGKTVFVYDENSNSYIAQLYNPLYKGQYYLHYEKIDGTGIEKEIENLNDKIVAAQGSIYNVTTKSLDESYITLTTNIDHANKQKEIILDMGNVEFNHDTGYISNGVITTDSLTSAFSYVFNWNLL